MIVLVNPFVVVCGIIISPTVNPCSAVPTATVLLVVYNVPTLTEPLVTAPPLAPQLIAVPPLVAASVTVVELVVVAAT